ncbi:MAG: glycine cleavage system aminomethyltransferase GcvT [Propionicimonas sp.]|uniref:glycine cleavage system aminomethyltransferase GcvT n=1 Tax=Propionicimonas sp. TaxID=1955623 RepID=UPI002B2088BA|nr:glycine cleavage system aminomethyltransferase GcvT [Propionicimonas sp.]MEA4944080.1 glycine cleavage system aminomethyltransferase GcvT [Propionicimonas sp.]
MTEPRLSPLHDRHVALGAKFSEFGGWLMPLQYSGVIAEHKAVRSAVGVFDVSHLGKVRVSGEGAVSFLNTCLTNDLNRIGAGQAQYTLACNDAGGVIDDLIAYRLGDTEVLLIPNAANTATVVAALRDAAPAGIEVVNQHTDYAVIAVQGTYSDETLGALGLPVGQGYMHFVEGTWASTSLTVCRTGYTGERGYELVVPNAAAGAVWDAVLAAGKEFDILPSGLGARDTLRTEMGYPLHGQDLSPSITAVQAGLTWAVGWDKPEFWGSVALKQQKAAGASRLLRGLKAVGRGIPRPHMAVVDADGSTLGELTSGTFSPTLGTGIGLALIDRSVTPGGRVGVAIRDRVEEFEVVRPPFVTPAVREQ